MPQRQQQSRNDDEHYSSVSGPGAPFGTTRSSEPYEPTAAYFNMMPLTSTYNFGTPLNNGPRSASVLQTPLSVKQTWTEVPSAARAGYTPARDTPKESAKSARKSGAKQSAYAQKGNHYSDIHRLNQIGTSGTPRMLEADSSIQKVTFCDSIHNIFD